MEPEVDKIPLVTQFYGRITISRKAILRPCGNWTR
jgi:hypothetical protein